MRRALDLAWREALDSVREGRKADNELAEALVEQARQALAGEGEWEAGKVEYH